MRRILVPLDVSGAVPDAHLVLHSLGGATMGTTWSARVMGLPGAAPLLAAALEHELALVVDQMSHWEPESNLSKYNSAAAGSWHALPPELLAVLRYALQVAEDSGGAFDPCAGALVNAWGFGARQRYNQADFYAPPAATLAAIVARGDRRRVQLDVAGARLLQPGAVQLDLSSVAKGYAVDQLARCLHGHGLQHFLVEIGGELRGAGTKAGGEPWWVELESVPGQNAPQQTLVALHNLAVATSGDYQRYFEHDGQRASHTIDPRNGQPIRNEVASVSVLHADCMAADALSTALVVLGPEAGLALAERHHLAARFLVRRTGGLEEIVTSAFSAMLQ